jgi:hypothetical protein
MTKLTADSFAPPLRSTIGVDCREGILNVHITLAPDQSAGCFNGVFRAPDGAVAGDLTVKIGDLPK